MKIIHTLVFILLVVGGINWGVYGIFGVDIGQLFGGMDATISRAIYVLVGLSAIYSIFSHKKECKECC